VGGPQITSANRESANLLDLRALRKCDSLRICDLRTLSFLRFAGLKLQQSAKTYFSPFNITDNSNVDETQKIVLVQSSVVFCRNLRICDLLVNQKNLQIYDLQTGTTKKIADLRFAGF
jgi:hypothetical protein